MNSFRKIPRSVVETLIWTLDVDGNLRGGRVGIAQTNGEREDWVRLCPKFQPVSGQGVENFSTTTSSKGETKIEHFCTACGIIYWQHELVTEQAMLPELKICRKVDQVEELNNIGSDRQLNLSCLLNTIYKEAGFEKKVETEPKNDHPEIFQKQCQRKEKYYRNRAFKPHFSFKTLSKIII